MAQLVERKWVSRDLGWTKKGEVRECDYLSYIPDQLVGRKFTFSEKCLAHVAEAEAAVRSLSRNAVVLDRTDGLARLLLRAESAASSRIEGIDIGAQRLLRADAARDMENGDQPDPVAEEVLANIDAMDLAMELADFEPRVTIDTVLRIHERVLKVTELRHFAGKVRPSVSWIGGNAYNPCSASFVPPPAEEVPRLLEDLAEFCNDTSLPAVAQAAIVHAQFETIHPFVDGNGRTGRALTHVMLRRRGLSPCWCPPVSLVLATLQPEYLRALDGYHPPVEVDAPEMVTGVDNWVAFFAQACTRSVNDAALFEERISGIQADWRERLGHVRRGSSLDLLLDAIPRTVILTASQAAKIIDRSFTAANSAIEQLVKAGILKQVNIGKRNRAFEATEVLSAFTQLERRLASPAGDTRIAPPVRPVPKRQK